QRLVLSGFSHDAAASMVSVAVGVLIALLLVFSLPLMTAEAANWQQSSMRYLDGGVNLLMATLKQLEGNFSMLARAHLSAELTQGIANFSEHFAQKYLAGALMTIAAWAPSLLLAPFLAFFMLRDGWRFKRFVGQAVPNAFFERTLYLLDQVDRTARQYFVGLLQLTLLDAVCLAAGLWLLGVSAPLALGLVTAVLAWVPYVGSIVGCLLVVLVAATDFPAQPEIAYGAVVLFLVVRLLDDFFFMPLTVGKSLNIHPLLTVLMIFVGGAVAGVPGLMLVLPVLGVAIVFGETLGLVVTDPRLRARHVHARTLRERIAAADL
ncbi:MAG: putative permease, partial [Proteobacteria bacterium]|nr:putative permease [Pseudomonadota bacterium]